MKAGHPPTVSRSPGRIITLGLSWPRAGRTKVSRVAVRRAARWGVRYIVGLATGLRGSHRIISGASDRRKGGAVSLAGLRTEPVTFDLDIPYAGTDDPRQRLDTVEGSPYSSSMDVVTSD